MTKNDHIDNIMRRYNEHLEDLFDDPQERERIYWGFSSNLSKLSARQIEVLDNPELNMTNISHDVLGIARKDRHFLPRIAALQPITPYLT